MEQQMHKDRKSGCSTRLVVVGLVIMAIGAWSLGVIVHSNRPARDAADTANWARISPTPTLNPTVEAYAFMNTCRMGPGYEDLARYTEKYVGECLYYKARIVQVQEHSASNYTVRFEITRNDLGWWDDDVYASYSGTFRPLEDDVVDVYGLVTGRKSYTTVLGAQRTIPQLDVVVMNLAPTQ